jgi:hypothetical protein
MIKGFNDQEMGIISGGKNVVSFKTARPPLWSVHPPSQKERD